MTWNFDARKPSGQEAASEMDSLQRDRFELLSAYIDGEVTAAERSYVQELLATNSDVQCLYTRLLKLRQGLQTLPTPAVETTAQDMTRRVFSAIDRRRIRQGIIWGGGAVAALFISTLSGILPGSQTLAPRLAQTPQKEVAPESMIIVSRPLVEIPKAPLASPDNKLTQPAVRHGANKNEFN